MIIVRRCEDRDAFVEFLFPLLLHDFRRDFPQVTLTVEAVRRASAPWDVLVFFDAEENAIVGVGCREKNDHIHTYVDRRRRLRSWSPHASMKAMYDIFLSDRDALYTAIPLTDKTSNKLAVKLGFVHNKIEDGKNFYTLTSKTRRPLGGPIQRCEKDNVEKRTARTQCNETR